MNKLKEFERNVCVVLLLCPYAVYSFFYIVAPGFIVPFFNHPVARIVIAVVVMWNLFGVYCLLKYNIRSSILRYFCVSMFGVPLLFAPILGPALVTIINALPGIY